MSDWLSNRWVRLLGLVLAVVAVAFLGERIVAGWAEVSRSLQSANLLLMLAALVVIIVAEAAVGIVWGLNIRTVGGRSTLLESTMIHFASAIGRATPGMIATTVSRVALASSFGAPPRVAIVAHALELIGSSTAAALFGLTLPTAILPGWLDSRLLVLMSILGMTGVVVAIEPLSRRFLRSQAGDAGPISRRVLVRSIVLYAVIWFMFGIAMQLVIRALGFGSLGLFNASASYAFAWLIGFVVVVIPGGLGVREGVLAAAVGPSIGGPEAAFVALTMRVLWWIATGAVGVVGSAWIGRATRQT